ncbi:MAG: hypothetical protein M3R17_16215 [Bacteroidota bacterium]|nr:hypothetical protein [Bacteroidota bacterium]
MLFIYAVVYAAERTTYVDSAWLFFKGVNNENFAFGWERFGAFISEIPLFIAVKLHVPFKALVYTFSLGYPLLYYFVWCLCTYKLKNAVAGLVILFGMIMGVRETFLHTVTETHQLIVYSALFFAVLEYEFKNNLLKKIIAGITLFLVLFTHPFGLFTAGFVLLYHIVKTKKWKDSLPLIVLLFLSVAGTALFFWFDKTYNAAQFAQFKNPSLGGSTGNFALGFIRMHFFHFYWMPEVAALIAGVWLIARKEWLKLVALTFSVTIYMLIILVAFRNGDASIMMERIFLPAFFMVNLILADLMANEKRINKWIPMVLAVFFLVNGIRYINTGCLLYKKRVAYLDQIVKDGIAAGHDLYYLSPEKTDKERILAGWALGTETLIYSKFKYDKCISISTNDEICPPGTWHTKISTCQPVQDLSPHYFQLSGRAYVELK